VKVPVPRIRPILARRPEVGVVSEIVERSIRVPLASREAHINKHLTALATICRQQDFIPAENHLFNQLGIYFNGSLSD